MNTAYSQTPLVKKLGIKENFKIRVINSPNNYFDLLETLPSGVEVWDEDGSNFDFIHFFVNETEVFENQLLILRSQIKKNGMIWISWYKKAAKKPTELNEDMIRNFALANGLVDVKVCAIDALWSGLKLVIRVKDR
jgi:hypothetical protein